jgi:hypothetical protein
MTQSKKYDCRVTQDTTGWTADIIRRVSAKKSHTSKTQGGFATETEARAWGEAEVKAFLHKRNLAEQKRRRERKEAQTK